MSARARNALRRGALLGGIATTVFILAIFAFILVPRKASRRAEAVAAKIETKTDSGPAFRGILRARAQITAADTLLAAARRMATPIAPRDTFPAAVIARRESLSVEIRRLETLIERSQSAPLPSSFRALAGTSSMASEPQMRPLLDSLAAIERDRTAYGAVGAADPGYAALSARAADIGKTIIGVAAAKRDRLRAELSLLRPPTAPPIRTVFVDTMKYLSDRAAAVHDYTGTSAELTKTRAQNQRIDKEMEHARELANIGAPPWAMLAAALVLAAALGFAGSLALELQRPNVADAREAEQVSGERVLAVIGRAPTVVERGRRQVDVNAPPLIDVISEAYRDLYLHIASIGADLPIVTITGDEPEIFATVASNLAASVAYEARSALLVDIDASTSSVAAVLRVPSNPGLAGILTGTASWPEAVRPTTIGRDRPLDVLPSGTKRTGMLEPHMIERTRAEFASLQRRYDFIIISAPTSYVQRRETSVIPSEDVILTARIGRTKLTALRSAAESLRGTNMRIQGIVLWNAPFPQLEKKEELIGATRSKAATGA